jgi:hypothetical protein
MALKNGTPNPLNILDQRRVKFPAHHFHYTKISKYSPSFSNTIDHWIYENLNSRYYVGQAVDLSENTIIYSTKIGFESEKELSFFRLACPHLN